MHRWRVCLAALLLALGATTGALADQATINLQFTRTDVPDAIVGLDDWRHSYTLRGALGEFGGVTLLFDPTRFADLALGPVDPVLSALVVQPDAALGADGLVQLTALGTLPATFQTQFDLDFVRIGPLADTHPFEVFDDNFNVIASGQASLVPEPAAAAMMVSGILLVAAWRRRSATPPS